ncbi:hypothetical protein KRE47_08360 [Elizabethkingia meningoseptica]|uniref:hypothetical protein n=1 Tax=Elizabethkingia meningoseptica TaxID=238 RepID=UPI0022F164C4|nr:hypothetical protein [Elizabethkingia meningoseptica]EJK5329692.1 hypothetical protein [Elizabethkingia meningoseptica]MDE5468047.1 hypothetical protein [Elizabethkingia meningoseptica]MDE5474966.1 hypothetical protein [Elizabethkingia meningoseptica]MDE5478399.1 hypothetical protein [Elizabethkingia meningoseptica]MDE5486798.1 hypothetical protein [Elizabethkingia meningoseptica]
MVTEPEDYYFSSAGNYADLDSVIDVDVVLWRKDIKPRITNPRHQRVRKSRLSENVLVLHLLM